MEISWEGSGGRLQGTMSDIGSTGCFILGPGDVEDGDRVRIDMPLNTGGSVALWGVVANHIHEIGFGIRFVALTELQKDYLERFTDTLRSD